MKTLKHLITATLFTSIAGISAAQADVHSDNELYNIIHPESADIFNVGKSNNPTHAGIVSLNDDYNKDAVWSFEFEQYVNPEDFQKNTMASVDDVNSHMGSNPTASAGMKGREVFVFNETAQEYHLQ